MLSLRTTKGSDAFARGFLNTLKLKLDRSRPISHCPASLLHFPSSQRRQSCVLYGIAARGVWISESHTGEGFAAEPQKHRLIGLRTMQTLETVDHHDLFIKKLIENCILFDASAKAFVASNHIGLWLHGRRETLLDKSNSTFGGTAPML